MSNGFPSFQSAGLNIQRNAFVPWNAIDAALLRRPALRPARFAKHHRPQARTGCPLARMPCQLGDGLPRRPLDLRRQFAATPHRRLLARAQHELVDQRFVPNPCAVTPSPQLVMPNLPSTYPNR